MIEIDGMYNSSAVEIAPFREAEKKARRAVDSFASASDRQAAWWLYSLMGHHNPDVVNAANSIADKMFRGTL